MSRTIEVRQGVYALVDAEDYHLVCGHSWHLRDNRYASTTIRENGSKRNVRMHHMVLDAHGLRAGCDDLVVDHINGNGLDNRKANLRMATFRDNGRNRRLETVKSGFRGVHPNSKVKRWEAAIACGEIKAEGKSRRIYLGIFATPQEAAVAVDLKLNELGWVTPRNFASPEAAEEAILSAIADRNRRRPKATRQQREQFDKDNARAMDLLREVLQSRRAA